MVSLCFALTQTNYLGWTLLLLLFFLEHVGLGNIGSSEDKGEAVGENCQRTAAKGQKETRTQETGAIQKGLVTEPRASGKRNPPATVDAFHWTLAVGWGLDLAKFQKQKRASQDIDPRAIIIRFKKNVSVFSRCPKRRVGGKWAAQRQKRKPRTQRIS